MAILKSLVCLFLLSFSVIYTLQPRQSNNLIFGDASTEYPSLSSIPEQSTSDLKKIRGCANHETFSSCEAHCEKTCDNFDKSPSCPRFCSSGCVCEEGYVRDVSGRCILEYQCPVRQEAQLSEASDRCRVNEHFEVCTAHCQKNCYNYNRPVPCPKICISGCACNSGYVRGPEGICIPTRQCPIPLESQRIDTEPKCEENEYFEICKAHCQKDCSNHDSPVYCPATCVAGCVCQEGYVRGPEGKCIPTEQCPSLIQRQPFRGCPTHEHYDPCLAHCHRDCSNLDLPVICPNVCIPGCICDEGYVRMNVDVRNASKPRLCVLPENCPAPSYSEPIESQPKCEKYEYFDVCKAHCQKDCNNYDDSVDCPAMCVPGCVCQEGYVRGPEGNCMPVEQCSSRRVSQPLKTPPRCPADEFFHICNAHCQKDCSNYDRPTHCPAICVPGCMCKKGYVRSPEGRCIPSEQCPLQSESQLQGSESKCPENEYFDVCKAHCQKDCSNTNNQRYCPDICVSGCVCKEGYVRGPEGSCIPAEQCQEKIGSQSFQDFSICPTNEHFDVCRGHCQRDCNHIENPLACPSVCIPGCLCDTGYVRGPKGKCIPVEQCQVSKQSSCPLNERFDSCNSHCQKTCSNYNEISVCPEECNPGCVCENGFVRGPQGNCIPVRQCLKLYKEQTYIPPFDRNCPPREHWEFCTGHCQRNCSNYDKPLICPQICVEGCLCDRGYTRGPKGDCIPESECEVLRSEQTTETFLGSVDVCSENEEYSDCKANPMCQKTCSNYDKSIFCPKVCIPGCVCKKGYVKSSEGECIPVETCLRQNEKLQKVCPDNMQYSKCEADPWCQLSCTSNVDPSCPRSCVSGCVCKEGYVRGPHGRCVVVEACLLFSVPESNSIQYSVESCPENEEYSLTEAACQKNCMNFDKPQRYCPVTIVPGCVCKEGFVRSPYGQCIPVEKCSEELMTVNQPYKCPKNSHHSRCGGSILCQETCSTYQKPDSCAVMCIEGCACNEGFVLSPERECIPPSQCPEQKEMSSIQNRIPLPSICKKNEVFSICATACPDDCSNYKDTNRQCTSLCLPGCVCKKGTVRGPDGDCIDPQQCSVEKKPEDCTMYEYYDTCGTSCPDDCTNHNQLNKQCNQRCVAGCFCQPGFVKGPNGDCIFPFNCPKQQYASLDVQKTQQTSAEDYGCPNERMCNAECKRRGRSYGLCIGPKDVKCECF